MVDDNESLSRADGAAGSGAAGAPVEVSAKSVEDAVAQALQRLGVSREDVEVEVLHPGSPGRLLGFGAEPARVRVTPLVQVEPLDFDGAQEEDQVEEEELDEHDAFAPALHGAPLLGVPETEAGEAEIARRMLAEILAQMGFLDASVAVVSVDPLQLDVSGEDLADLIGRRGEHLRALQFVLSLMLNKQLRKHIRVTVDVDGYRARREDLLRNMALRFANRVRLSRSPMQLEAMPPNERRIVHMALAEDPDVYTESTGEGDARRVVILPRR